MIKKTIVYGLAVTLLVSAVAITPYAGTARAATTQDSQALLQGYADRLQEAGNVGVLVHAMNKNGASIRARAGTSIRGTSLPVAYDSHFKTGSTTKTFVATVILQLESEGKLSLDDTVEHWLPGLVQGNGYDGSHITVRQLLNHTSGIFDYTLDENFFATISTPESFNANRFRTYTPQQLVAIALTHPPVFAPGESWDYSNTNYVIAGMLIKAVTGHPWGAEVHNRIAQPLGLTETTSAGNASGLPLPFAMGYHIFTEDPAERTYTNTTLHNMSWAQAAGDMITTTRDENIFFRALMKGQLLSATQLVKMKTIIPLGEGVGYGLGIIWTSLPCDTRGAWSHDGGVVGYATSNGVTDDGKRSAVVSLSTTTFTDLEYAEESGLLRIDAVNDALCTGQPTVSGLQPKKLKGISVDPAAVARLRGSERL
jgi:D-alanyl-D-alanine carboxypeptidase